VSDEPQAPKRYLTTTEAAAYLRCSRQKLEIARHKGFGGPPYIKFGKIVLYDIGVIDAYLAEQNRTHTGEAA
jgi:hypothetical protein